MCQFDTGSRFGAFAAAAWFLNLLMACNLAAMRWAAEVQDRRRQLVFISDDSGLIARGVHEKDRTTGRLLDGGTSGGDTDVVDSCCHSGAQLSERGKLSARGGLLEISARWAA
jgi:hypothetical protein